MNPCKNHAIGTMLLSVFILMGCNSTEDFKPVDPPRTSEPSANGSRSKAPSASGSRAVPSEVATPVSTKAFKDQIAEIPGNVEAENFDEGEPNVAYVDQDKENLGADDYRGPTQVDLEKRGDASGGYGVGWTQKGEWLTYTVRVKATGVYQQAFIIWKFLSPRRSGAAPFTLSSMAKTSQVPSKYPTPVVGEPCRRSLRKACNSSKVSK